MATERLTRVNFDLLGLTVRRVEVNDGLARFERKAAHELVITPSKVVRAGDHFKTVVTYDGKPTRDHAQIPSGWFNATTPGAGFIAGEPHSCTVWYPCNDHPTDKAAFWLSATVPTPLKVVSVGRQGKTTGGTRGSSVPVRTYRWRLNEATATYLTTIYIDRLTLERSRLRRGIPVVSAYGPNPGAALRRAAKLPQVLRVLSRRWGRYPAPTAGGIFVTGDVPLSLETFGRPIYSEGANVGTIVHENAHQWWGDNVSIKRWRDICFSECSASYTQWLWREHQGQDLDLAYRRGVQGTPRWLFGEPLYDMGAGNEFGYGVYVEGPYFLHALRNKIGDHPFFIAMRAIQRQHAGGNLSMLDLRDILEHKTGAKLTSFWQQWVLDTGPPSRANLYPGDLSKKRTFPRRQRSVIRG